MKAKGIDFSFMKFQVANSASIFCIPNYHRTIGTGSSKTLASGSKTKVLDPVVADIKIVYGFICFQVPDTYAFIGGGTDEKFIV